MSAPTQSQVGRHALTYGTPLGNILVDITCPLTVAEKTQTVRAIPVVNFMMEVSVQATSCADENLHGGVSAYLYIAKSVHALAAYGRKVSVWQCI